MKHAYLIGAVLFTFSVLGFISWYAWVTPTAAAAPPRSELPVIPPPTTVICGKFSAPPLLVGTPISVPTGGTAVAFTDGYLLQLKEVPSLFINKRALFQITDGKVVNYGLVAEDYNPCPAKS